MKIGDRVTVYRKVKVDYWVYYMDGFVGCSGTIEEFSQRGTPLIQMDDGLPGLPFYFPKSSLKYEVKP